MSVNPGWHAPLVGPDGRLSKPFIDYLRGLSGGDDFDATALEARLAVLEGLAFVGIGVSVVGTIENGFVITASNTTDPLACQIFGS